MQKPVSIKKHLSAIDDLLKSPHVYETDVQRHLYFIASFPIFLFKIPVETYVYRARTSFDNESFSQIPKISYAPKGSVKHYGRANFPNQSLFYCSEDQETAYLELLTYWVKNVVEGQIFQVTMGEWVTTKIFESIIVTTPNIAQRKSKFEIGTGNAYDIKMREFSPDQQIIAKEFYSKFYDWYSRPARVGDDLYRVTSNISNKLITSGKKLGIFKNAAISYPSVASHEEGINFAFEPKIVASGKLRCVRTWRLKLIANLDEYGNYNFKEVHREHGRINDNTIYWP